MVRKVRNRSTLLALLAALSLFLFVGCSDSTVGPSEVETTLSIDIADFRSDGSANVTVYGPDGFEEHITESKRLSGVPEGEYVVRAEPVEGDPETWYPTAEGQEVTMRSESEASVTVRYAHVPAQGEFVPELDEVEGELLRWMRLRSIKAGAFAVMYNRRMVMTRAYGWYDADHTSKLDIDAIFRLASGAKPLTRAAIRELIDEGHISLDTKVFPYMDIDPLPEGTGLGDERLNDITVDHLLNHYPGWDQDASNPLSRDVSKALDLTRPPTTREIVRWAMGQPLQEDPGTTNQYSNLGFWVLSVLVEEVSGRDYVDYIQEEVMSPEFSDGVIFSRTRPEDRDPREPWYPDPYEGCSVFIIETCEMISQAKGGRYHNENRLGGGGLAGSAPAMLDFLGNYWTSSGETRTGSPRSMGQYGRFPGARTLVRQHSDGFDYVVLFNQRSDPSGLSYNGFHEFIDDGLQEIDRWP